MDAVKEDSPRARAPRRGSSGQAGQQPQPNRHFEAIVDKAIGGFEAVKLIRNGFSAHMLKSASGYLGVPEKRILEVVHVPTATAHRLQKNDQNVDPGATERLYRMGAVTRMAIEVFENEELAKEWLRRPNRSLANEAPLDLLDTEPGSASVRQVLNAIATGGVL